MGSKNYSDRIDAILDPDELQTIIDGPYPAEMQGLAANRKAFIEDTYYELEMSDLKAKVKLEEQGNFDAVDSKTLKHK